MAYAFALGANESLPQAKEVEEPEVHDLEWFKEQLREAGVSSLQIQWNAQEHFNAVEPQYMHKYLGYRRFHLHREALAHARSDIDGQ